MYSLYPTIAGYRRNYCNFGDALIGPDTAPFYFDIIIEIAYVDRVGHRDMQRRSEDPEVRAQIV